MMLLVATTLPLLFGGDAKVVVEVAMEDNDAEDADEKAVLPDNWEARGACPMPPG